jgi:hypothetical protein
MKTIDLQNGEYFSIDRQTGKIPGRRMTLPNKDVLVYFDTLFVWDNAHQPAIDAQQLTFQEAILIAVERFTNTHNDPEIKPIDLTNGIDFQKLNNYEFALDHLHRVCRKCVFDDYEYLVFFDAGNEKGDSYDETRRRYARVTNSIYKVIPITFAQALIHTIEQITKK